MQLQPLKSIRRTGVVLLLSTTLLWGMFVVISQNTAPAPAQAANENDVFDDVVANRPPQQSRECDGTETGRCSDGTCTHSESEVLACVFSGGVAEWYGADGPPPTPAVPAPVPTIEVISESSPPSAPAPSNLIINGNFESGFYAVPELGFEPPDIGNVPKGWSWYRNQAYGKYTIFNNQTLGLECPFASDAPPEPVQDNSFFGPIPGVTSNEGTTSALGFHIQSSDEQDARIGVYQVVDGLVPGQSYRFSMSGTLQIQSGATTLQPDDPKAPEEAQNHTFELYFDFSGNTDWRAIPHKNWTQIEFKEQKLEFKVSEDNDDISVIQDYTTFFTAESNQVTIFVTFWRKWANWRTGIGSVDCLALMPATPQMIQAAQKPRTNFVDLSGGTAHPSNAQPAAAGLRPDNQLPVTGDQSSLPPQPLEQEQPASAPSNQSHQAESDTSVSLEEQKEQPIEAAESSAVALETETDVGQSNVPPQSESLPQTETVSSAETENVDVAAVAPSNMGLDITSSPVLILFGAVVAAFAVVGVGLWAMRR